VTSHDISTKINNYYLLKPTAVSHTPRGAACAAPFPRGGCGKSHCCDRGVDAGQSADALLAGGGTYRAIGSAPSVQLTESALGHVGEVTEEVEEDEPKILTMG